MLGTSRLTIARAINQRGNKGNEGEFFFWTNFGKLNFENFQRKKNQNNVGVRNHAHSYDGPV